MRKFIEMLIRLRFRNRHQMYAVILLAMFSLISIYAILKLSQPEPPKYQDRFKTREQVKIKLIADAIKDDGIQCEIPKLDPFTDEMMKYHRDSPKIKCEGVDWVDCKGSTCSMNEKVLKNMREVTCVYKDILYKDEHHYEIANPVRVSNGGIYHLNRSDYVKVSCTEKSLPGLGIIARRWHGYKAGLRPVQIEYSKPSPESINVMILCFDSTSHNGFRRKMPRSYKTLTEELDAIVLNGYNIVGDGTPAAIFPLVTGKTDLEMTDGRIKVAKNELINPEDFIFKKLRKYGYQTAYYEDTPTIGTFTLRFNGFKYQPADHYIRPFFLEESKYGKKWWNGINRRFCVGAIPQYGLMLNISKQVLNLDKKHFCFTFIVDISHDDFTYISIADDDVVAFLRYLKHSKKLHDHLVIVMGDHGSRLSLLRESYQGKMEERLPLMGIILPEILKKNRPEALMNLKSNVQLLTTPFDIYATIVDAMGLPELKNNYTIPGSSLPRGLSLLKPIPKTRTCGQAGVLSHWCVCAKWQNVSEDDPIYYKVVDALVEFINDLTIELRSKCLERQLTSAEWVMRQSNNDDLLQFQRGSDGNWMHDKYVPSATKTQPTSEIYQAKIVMSPGRALYEGSMSYDVIENKFIISEKDISRITANRTQHIKKLCAKYHSAKVYDTTGKRPGWYRHFIAHLIYGDEPKCIIAKHPHLSKFCFCKEMQTKIKVIS